MKNIDFVNESSEKISSHEPEAIIENLSAMYPHLTWEIENKDETAYVDDEVNNRLIGLVTVDSLIFDLFSSECGRFKVDPAETYGISILIANVIKKYNKID